MTPIAPVTVLVVEPDDARRERLVVAVDRAGHHAIGLTTVQDAVARRGRQEPPIALLTAASWRDGGPEFLHRRASHEEPVRIALVVSERDARRRAEFEEEGVTLVLVEPVGALEIMTTIEALLRGPPSAPRPLAEPPDPEDDALASLTTSLDAPLQAPLEVAEERWADPAEVRAALRRLAEGMRTGETTLGNPSPSSLELQGLVGRPETTLLRLVQSIELDPRLAAAILKASNTTAYRGLPSVLDLESAGRRLGAKRLGEIAQTEALRSVTPRGVQGWSRLLARMRRNTVVTAQTCREVASKVGEHNLGAVYTMALLHNLGEVLIVDLYQRLGYEPPRHGIADGALEREMNAQHAALGTLLLRSWRLPPSIAAVAFHHHDPRQLPPGTPVAKHAWLVGGSYAAVIAAGSRYKRGQEQGPAVAEAAAALGIDPGVFKDAAMGAIARWAGSDEAPG